MTPKINTTTKDISISDVIAYLEDNLSTQVKMEKAIVQEQKEKVQSQPLDHLLCIASYRVELHCLLAALCYYIIYYYNILQDIEDAKEIRMSNRAKNIVSLTQLSKLDAISTSHE